MSVCPGTRVCLYHSGPDPPGLVTRHRSPPSKKGGVPAASCGGYCLSTGGDPAWLRPAEGGIRPSPLGHPLITGNLPPRRLDTHVSTADHQQEFWNPPEQLPDGFQAIMSRGPLKPHALCGLDASRRVGTAADYRWGTLMATVVASAGEMRALVCRRGEQPCRSTAGNKRHYGGPLLRLT